MGPLRRNTVGALAVYVKGYERGPVDAPSKTDVTKVDS